MASDPSYPATVKLVLEMSNSPYAIMYAARSLRDFCTTHWSRMDYNTKLGTQRFAITFLAQKGATLPPFVVMNVCELVARISKLAWFEGDELRNILPSVQNFMANGATMTLGLKMLAVWVFELHSMLRGQTLSQHRKIATSFRDKLLLPVFNMALGAHRQVLSAGGGLTDDMRAQIQAAALELSLKCLGYDFIGTNPQESSEDAGTVQMPNTWRDLFEEESILNLYFQVYKNHPTGSSKALRCITHIASVRRSLFTGPPEREKFLTDMMRGLADILRNDIGLQEPANHHEVCRLLARLKANFQLKQIVRMPAYQDFISLVSQFSIKSFQAWRWAPNSIYYLLSLWSRLISSIAYLQHHEETALENFAPRILESYVRSRLESVQVVAQSGGTVEDPLDAACLRAELECLPTLGRIRFAPTATFLGSVVDPLVAQYQQHLHQMSPAEAFVIEGRLTWMVNVIAAVIGGRLATSATPNDDYLDGGLAARLFNVMKLHDERIQRPGFAPSAATPKLELALLKFLAEFRKINIGDYATQTSSVYMRLGELVGLNDHHSVLSAILLKICNNLKFWAENKEIVTHTIMLCNQISSGYASGKLLRKVELTTQLFQHHTSQFFPFLDVPANARSRTKFYNTLAKLLFLDCSVRDFNQFMNPFRPVFVALLGITTPEGFMQPQVQAAVIGLLRDLRGIVDATISGTTYNMFFDWIYESKGPTGARYTDVLTRAAEVYFHMPELSTPLLKFQAEFVHNKSARIAFDSSSPNGILLFRLASEVLCAYGNKILDYRVPQEKVYSHKYKGIWICLKILKNALEGGYLNFGIFKLYGDPALANALDIAFKMMFSVPLGEIMGYPKFQEAYYGFVNTLCTEHTSAVAEVNTMIFGSLLEGLREGLQSLDQGICSHCCAALDKLADFYYHQLDRSSRAALGIKELVHEYQMKFCEILDLLFNIIIYEECLFQWSISRPMLSLIVINPPYFAQFQQRLCESMPTSELAQKMTEALAELMKDIEQNLSGKNRDTFTQKLSVFRHTVKLMLT